MSVATVVINDDISVVQVAGVGVQGAVGPQGDTGPQGPIGQTVLSWGSYGAITAQHFPGRQYIDFPATLVTLRAALATVAIGGNLTVAFHLNDNDEILGDAAFIPEGQYTAAVAINEDLNPGDYLTVDVLGVPDDFPGMYLTVTALLTERQSP